MRKTWMFASTLLIATACGDDESDSTAAANDGGRDAAADASNTGTIDGGHDAGSIDAALQDASTPADAQADAATLALEIEGLWHADFGGEFEFSATKFGDETVIELDRTARTAVTFTAADGYFPNTYSLQAWTAVTNGSFYQCTHDYNKPSAAEAKVSTMKLDASKPATGGCGDGDFPWTQYGPVIEIRGDWTSNGAAFKVDSDHFGAYAIESYDNAANDAVLAQGGGDAGMKTFGKLVWSVATATRVNYCIVASGLTTAAEAAASPATADATQPTTGCNGGAWSALTK